MLTHLRAYAATLVAMLVLDAVWLGLIAADWYRQGIGHLTAPQPFWAAASAFYLLYPAGLLCFAVVPQAGRGWRWTALAAALFGLCCYATYDLSNLATLRGWPIGLSLLDMVWGVLLSTAAACVGRWAYGSARSGPG